jgi:hypothetical protein
MCKAADKQAASTISSIPEADDKHKGINNLCVGIVSGGGPITAPREKDHERRREQT